MESRSVGKFILWAVIALVGWSFYSTLKHETAIAVQAEKLANLEDKVNINQRLRNIEKSLSALRE